MTRPLAYITAPWGEDHLENATLAARGRLGHIPSP